MDENGVLHSLIAAKSSYWASGQEVTVEESDRTGVVLRMNKSLAGDVVVIKSSVMEVAVDEHFPRAVSYKYQGKTFSGQEEVLDKLRINEKDVVPTVQSTVSGDHVTYRMEAVDGDNVIDAVITAELRVVDNTLEFNITEIDDKKMVKTIEIPDHNLISVTSLQEGAQLAGAEMSTNTHKSGDKIVDIDVDFPVASYRKKGYMYAFLSTHELSAGLWSNSENNVTGDWQRVTQTAVTKDGLCTEVALMSTPWTYQKDRGYRKQNGFLELEDGTVLSVQELPRAKVVITDDVNGDNKVDWQDGAVEYRKIMNSPTGSEKVPDLAAYRISMNFGSQAQNPFLMALDGVKKISLHTDGLGQSILLKGYGNEGHDSGHLNYADIGTRIGGAEDMKYLMKRGKEYGATFGIHINANETYPESKYFSEPLLKKNADGSYDYGWNWIDQGININTEYDLKHGRGQRFKDLYDVLGGENNDLEFIYVDVWGTEKSKDNGTWASSQLAKEINGLGWRLGAEWSYAFENSSIFQHWAVDLTYGGYGLKGINSQIARFLRNHEKDSWVGNYPSYGGAAAAPLLGGYNMKDFEGWQGRSDYDAYITNLFEVDVPSKFIQHYQVSNLEYGSPVTMTDNGETYSWTPEMMVRLRDKENIHSLVIKRMSNDYAGSKNAYMSRTMTYDDKRILEGREGDSKYLIPWYWDFNGGELAEDDRKLYHWNTNGGESTWELPEDWSGLSGVYVYTLTEYGKTEMQEVQVDDMTITLSAGAKIPYIVYKGEKDSPQMVWSEGMHVADSGFNSGNLNAWTITGAVESVKITKSQGSNNMLEISGNSEAVSLTQKLTDLEANTKYAAMIGVDNRSEASVEMEVDNGLGKITSKQGPKSIARNYIKAYAHNTNASTATVNNTSYFQNLLVFFETGEDVSSVTLTLKREADEAATYLDDIRIVKNNSENFVSETLFVQDFENMAQGIWPFVIGDAEGVEDNRTHLSEKHIPYTQRGWKGKVVSDVIQGNWSVKTNGLTQRQRLIYQTIPQNFMFRPGVDYVVSFDYEAGSDGTYALVYGDRPYEEAGVKILEEMKNTVDIGRARNYSFTLHGSETGQTWFGIYSTDQEADTRGVTDSGQINFNGYKDFMLDNLKIRVADTPRY